MKIATMVEERRKRLRGFVDRLVDGSFSPPQLTRESLAPEMEEFDGEALVLLARGELPEDLARCLYRRIFTFKSWCGAHTEAEVAEYHRNKQAHEQ